MPEAILRFLQQEPQSAYIGRQDARRGIFRATAGTDSGMTHNSYIAYYLWKAVQFPQTTSLPGINNIQ